MTETVEKSYLMAETTQFEFSLAGAYPLRHSLSPNRRHSDCPALLPSPRGQASFHTEKKLLLLQACSTTKKINAFDKRPGTKFE